MRILLSLFVLLFHTSAFLYGQGNKSVQIKGQIIAEDTGIPVEFATISVYDVDTVLLDGTITELDGNFTLNTPTSSRLVLVEYLSYISQWIDLSTYQTQGRVIDMGAINLAPAAQQLEGVEIRAERSATEFKLDRRVFNVGQDLANQGGTAQDILDNVPAVTVSVEGEVSLRGSAGVRLLIDGKPSGIVNADNANGLSAIPSNLIERVEVITNPSAKFEAEGQAGIINIILKKDKKSGFNGAFDATLGLPNTQGAGANLNYRKGNINWFTNYSYLHRRFNGFGNYQQAQFITADSTFYQDQSFERDRGGRSHNIRFGLDFIPTENETLTAALLYNTGLQPNDAKFNYLDYWNEYPDNLVYNTTRTDDEVEDESRLEYSLNYKKKFGKEDGQIEALIQYQDNKEDEASDIEEIVEAVAGPPVDPIFQRSANNESEQQWVFQLDFEKPIAEAMDFSFGLRTQLRTIDNIFKVEERNEQGDWVAFENFDNTFIYTEDVYAAYSTIGKEYDQWSYQLGLRAEYSDIGALLVNTDERNDRNYFNLFPSAFLNYKLSETHQLQASYSRRIRRPRFWDINPFLTFSDNRNLFRGNPDINPEYTDSYELGYIAYIGELTVGGALFYRYTTDAIVRLLFFNEDGTSERKPDNLATSDDYGVEANFQYSGLKNFRFDGNVNFLRAQINGQNVDDNFNADSFTWFGRVNARYKFWNDTDLQLRFNYRAPVDNPQGRTLSISTLDIAISKDLFNKQATLTFNVNDVFNTRRRRQIIDNDDIFREEDFQWRARTARLSFNYRINQKNKSRGGRPG